MKKGEFKYRVGDKIGGSTIKALCEKHIVITCSCGADKNMGRKNMYKFNGDCNCPKHLEVKPGSVWGRLTVTKATKFSKSKSLFECKCECGAIREVRSNSLITGKTTSCGCTRRSIQKDREDPIINDYASGLKIDDLRVKYKVGATQIFEMMDRRGKKRRNREESVSRLGVNQNCFEYLTRDSMYWLGILGSDGNVTGNRVTLGFKSSDIGHLQKFKEFCKSEHFIGTTKSGNFSSIKFASSRVVKSLAKFGIVEKKSLVFEPNEYCARHADFWRGMIDGDGCIHYKEKSVAVSLVSGSVKCITMFEKWVKSKCNTRANVLKIKGKKLYSFSISGSFAIEVLNLLYDPSHRYSLDRKYEKAKPFLHAI